MVHSSESKPMRPGVAPRSAEVPAPGPGGGAMVSLRRTVRHQHPPREVPLWWREWRARFEPADPPSSPPTGH